MALVIRFSRAGARSKPIFHLVVADKERPRDGKYIEKLGLYNPKLKDKTQALQIDREKVSEWIKKGAVVSQTVGQLLKATAKLH